MGSVLHREDKYIRRFGPTTYVATRGPRGCSRRSRSCHGSRIISRMNGELARISRSLLLAIVFGVATNEPGALPPGGGTDSQRALAVIETDHAGLCPSTARQDEFEATMARLADEIRAEPASGQSGPASLGALNRIIF